MIHSREPKFFLHALLVSLFLLFPTPGWSQGLGSLVAGSQKPAAAAGQADPLKRETPRSALYAFLQACHDGKYELASQYLDLRHIRSDQRAVQGPQLAKQLGLVLDRDTRFEVVKLSNEPVGSSGDGLPSDLEALDRFDLNQQQITLYLQRQTIGSLQAWMVSADSVNHLAQLAAATEESPIERRLPASLVQTRILGAPLWIWIALGFAAVLSYLAALILSRLFLTATRPISRRYSQKLHMQHLASFAGPIRLILLSIFFRAAMEFIGPSALLRDSLMKLLALLMIWAIASILMVIVDIVSDTITSRLDVRERALSYSVIPLLARSIKILFGFFALLTLLGAWGYNVNAVLAGLGVGGIAVALAAQKTIENLFGGIAVISDKPVLVGDFCQFGGQVGTIEDIGLRSTRIRTLDRTIVTIPNASFSTMTLENYAKRDRMWFHPTLNLRRDTTPEKIRAMMEAVTKVLEDHEKVDPTSVPLRFTKISKESFDLEIFAYVQTADFDEYLKVQSELLLGIVEAAIRLSVEFAVPNQEMLTPMISGNLAVGMASIPSSRNASITAPTAGE